MSIEHTIKKAVGSAGARQKSLSPICATREYAQKMATRSALDCQRGAARHDVRGFAYKWDDLRVLPRFHEKSAAENRQKQTEFAPRL